MQAKYDYNFNTGVIDMLTSIVVQMKFSDDAAVATHKVKRAGSTKLLTYTLYFRYKVI